MFVVEFDGYANRSGFATARMAIGGPIGWIGWTLGVGLTVIGGFASTVVLIIGAVLLVTMMIGAALRYRDRRDSDRIAKLPPLPLPDTSGEPRPEVHLPHLEVRHDE